MNFLRYKKNELATFPIAAVYKVYLLTITAILGIAVASIMWQKAFYPKSQFFRLSNNLFKEILTISPGSSLFAILSPYKFHYHEINELIKTARPHIDLTNIKPGQQWSIYSENKNNKKILKSIQIYQTLENRLEISRSKDGNFLLKKIIVPLKKEYAFFSGVIDSTLLEAIKQNNIPYKNIIEVINAHSYDIDFQRDIHKGTKYKLIIEKLIDSETQATTYGKTIFSSLELGKKTHNIYLYKMPTGEYEYINDNYTTVKRSLLKTPVQATRISSKFGMRKHPVLGYSKMHKGIDFAAPAGTPIYAAGNGRVQVIGRKGGYGRYIRIKHNSKLSTAYAHLLSYAKGLKKGQLVKQGQIIGKVGASGRATGAHLHYEVLINDKQVNPLTIKSNPVKKLKGEEKEKFTRFKSYIAKYTSSNQKTFLASNNKLRKFYES